MAQQEVWSAFNWKFSILYIAMLNEPRQVTADGSFFKLSHFLEFLENRFEAGTPAIGEAIGFGAAVDYLTNIGMQRIHNYEVLSFYFVNLAGLNNGG